MRPPNRREFIKEAALAGASLATAPRWGLATLQGSRAAGERTAARIQVVANGLLIDGKLWPIYSGSFHYWRHDRGLWPALFDSVSSLGLRTITTYIPWSVHEIERGKFDFGQLDNRKDIGAFLKLAHSKGFKVLARPGPHINSELTYFGFPPRVLFDERAQLRTASGARIVLSGVRAFPVPSNASRWFLDEVAVYFDALMPILRDLLHPHGPIIAIQSDNENSFFFHHHLAYSGDYHPDSLADYRAMLERKYGKSIQKLNERYGSRYASFSEVEPPREFTARQKEDIPYYLDWAEYREYYLTESENRFARMFRDRGITGIPIFQCTPQGYMTPFNLPQVEAEGVLAWSGINLYPGKYDYAETKRMTRAARTLSRFAETPEFGGGIWIYSTWGTRDVKDAEFCSLAAIMHGFKGFNFYMIVERDRWLACPITRDNRRRPGFYETYSKFIHFARDNRLEELEKQASITFITNNDADRLSATFSRRVEGLAPAAWPVTLPLADLALECGVPQYRSVLEQAYAALDLSGYDFDFGTTEVPLERLKRYPVIGMVTMDFVGRAVLAKLREYVRGGGHVVVAPVAPMLDEDLRVNAEAQSFFAGKERPGRGSVVVAASPEEFARQITARVPKPEFIRDNPAVDVSVHRSRDGRRKLVFLTNPTSLPQAVQLAFSGSRQFRDLWGSRNLSGSGSLETSLEPYSIGVWEVSAS